MAEPRVSRFPFSLTTGRLRDQWHGMTRTGTLGRLFAHVPEPVVQMHAQDMERYGIAEGELVFVTSKRGSLVVPAQASNTVVLIPGRDRTRPPVVVMTPRSSWYQSTAERGGGLVCWLEVLRALLANPPGCDTILIANSGHELGHIGLDAFMAARAGWETQARWVHFGANIGAANSKLAIMSGHADMAAPMAAALRQAGHPADQVAPTTSVPFGESRDIHRAGGRYVTLVGSNTLFHLPQDRLLHAVDLPAIARIAAGAAQMVLNLTRP